MRSSYASGALRKGALLLFTALLSFGFAQDRGPNQVNPLAGQLAALNRGRELFAANCAFCHGKDAVGGSRGPALTQGQWKRGDSDAALFELVSKGIPGTVMPASNLTETETWQVVTYLNGFKRVTAGAVQGDRAAGEQIFLTQCANCHMVKGRGGRLGPDLLQTLSQRSLDEFIRALREPDQKIEKGFETIRVITSQGKQLDGVRKNEDSFSLQMMERDGKLQLFEKSDVRSVTDVPRSLMTAFDDTRLNATQLQNLLAWLTSLRETETTQK